MMLFLKLLFFLLVPLNHFIKTKELLNRTLLSNYMLVIQLFPCRAITAVEVGTVKTDSSCFI